MQEHYMKLQQEPFRLIEQGKKVLELRLFDEKRKNINISDVVVFSRLPNLNKQITRKVSGLLIYTNFADLMDDIPMSLLGYKESDRKNLKNSVYDIYTPKQEKDYGVVGIRLIST